MKKVILFSLFLVFASCEKVIEFESEEVKPKLVLDSQFESDSAWSVKVSYSQSVLDNSEINPVTGADVRISDINGNFITQLTHDSDGIYTSTGFAPAAGNSYRIDASASGYDPVYSISHAPVFIPITSYDTSSVTINHYEQKKCIIRFQDPAGEGDRYIIQGVSVYWYPVYDAFGVPYDTVIQLNNTSIQSQNIHVVNGNHDNYQERIFLTDNLMNGGEVEVDFFIPGYYSENNSFGFVLWHVSEDYFQFTQTLDKYIQSAYDPFSQPVLVYSNIVNGLGVFAGFSKFSVLFF